MLSTTLALLSLTYLASAADEGSAFGDDVPVVAPKRSKLTLRKPSPTAEESESAFGDVDWMKDETKNQRETLSSKPDVQGKPTPVHEESAFGDVDYLRDVMEDAHAAPDSKPALRKKHEPQEVIRSAFGDVALGDSSTEEKIQQLDEKQSLVEESALGGELKDDAEDLDDDLDDKDMKHESEQGLGAMWDTKSGFTEDAEDETGFGGEKLERQSEQVSPSNAKACTGAQCNAEKWSPVRNVHAYGPSGKPANWKPRSILGKGAEQMADETPRARGARIYSRHQAVEHQSPQKRSLGEFMSSLMER